MARGKHRQASANRRARQTQAQRDSLRAELAAEREALGVAEKAAAHVDDLHRELARLTRDRHQATESEQERLTGYVDLLVPAAKTEKAAYARAQHQWDKVSAAAIKALGSGHEGIEAFMRLLDLPGILNDNAGRDLPAEAITRLQTIRGQRDHVISHNPDVTATRALLGLLRARWLRQLHEAGISTDPLPPHATMTVEQREVFAVVDQAAEGLLKTTPATLTADAIHAWHPLPWLHSRVDGDYGAALGTPPTQPTATAAQPAPVTVDGREWPPATPAMSAATGTRLAATHVDTLLVNWRDTLAARQALTRLYGRRAAPWAARPLVPRPGHAALLQHHYALAALGAWSRAADATDPAATAWGAAAVRLTAAAPYWLPPGQTYGFADSEPLAETDLDDLVLPFPQVLLTFAEPLQLPSTGTADADVTTTLDRFDLALLDLVRHHGAGADLHRWLVALGDDTTLLGTLSLGQALAARGGHVEGVLFCGDTLGRIADEFAWCVAVPSGPYGVLGRFVVPASLSATRYRAQVLNLAAVTAWADWHAPDDETALTSSATAADVNAKLASTAWRGDADRAGAGNVRVLDVKATTRGSGAGEPTGRHVAPHVRRGHWRRQRFGPGSRQVRRVRIAPVVVNAHRGAVAARVYRLPDPTPAQRH